MRFLDAFGDLGERQVPFSGVLQHRLHLFRVADVDFANEFHLHVFLQLRDQVPDLRHLIGDAWLHQRFDRRDKQVHHGFLPATEACAIAARERQVNVLVQEDRLESTDALLEVVDPDVFLRRVRQVEPEVPVLSQ